LKERIEDRVIDELQQDNNYQCAQRADDQQAREPRRRTRLRPPDPEQRCQHKETDKAPINRVPGVA